MVYTIEQIQEKIIPLVERYNLPAVHLFGSYARGEADENSDIDLVIVSKGSEVLGFAFYK
ncbi:nucleotidyltransferase family protein, partial [Streptococcus pasteurianus]|uniref:nucleotidyltransferase family protein n=2 Tax=Streptococcus TaxID=1301 RepID=UPI00294434B6